MRNVVRLNDISDFCERYGCTMLHPLITIVDFSIPMAYRNELRSCGFYSVLFQASGGKFTYGLSEYDYKAGTLVFIAPDQVFGRLPSDEAVSAGSRALLFHPAILRDSILASQMSQYSFFSYESKEALHMSDSEQIVMKSIFDGITLELKQSVDGNSRRIIQAFLSLFFSYCLRFYDRQFVSRNKLNDQLVEHFYVVLHQYLDSDLPKRHGLPSVSYCAHQLDLSANYFGDLVRKTTGLSAKDHIHIALVERVKHLIASTDLSISQIASEVGFKYPHHLSRVFRNVTGISPIEFRTRHCD